MKSAFSTKENGAIALNNEILKISVIWQEVGKLKISDLLITYIERRKSGSKY